MKPSPYQITAFTHAARERSFSKAARVLGVTQSSVTQHVAKLEQVMGTPLFIRRRGGLELTDAARELFALSDRLRDLEQLVAEKVQDYGSLSAGHLRIIANAPRPAMPVIARYLELFPKVQVEFTLVSWTLGMRQLKDRDVDVAIIAEPGGGEGLTTDAMEETCYKLHLRHDHRLAGLKRVGFADLLQETVILPEAGSLTERVFKAKAKELGFFFPRILQTTTFPVIQQAILHGMGVGLLLEDSLFPSQEIMAISLVEMPERYRNHLVTPADKRELRIVRSFCDVALDRV